MALEENFDPAFTAALALREKQIQQSYRPVIGVHKWFARRPGTLFRSLLLAEYDGHEDIRKAFYRAHRLSGLIADPFMGGGTPLIEANRLGFHVVGLDINPMAYWIVHQELDSLNVDALLNEAGQIVSDVAGAVCPLYETECTACCGPAMVKYFLWVKTQDCPACGARNDLFPGYLLAEAQRHPRHVFLCADCSQLVELDYQPHEDAPAECPHCGGHVQKEGPARRSRSRCRCCAETLTYPRDQGGPPEHRMWAIEYHCPRCKPTHTGRFFKTPSPRDQERVETAGMRLALATDLPIPDASIPLGDETTRLHRWGYRCWKEMFSPRQLLGLGLLLQRIEQVPDLTVQHALLTIFSDSLRYQNMLCRYDTYALKCQDIFSVHGFPVGLLQCENNLLGIPGVGSGGFQHFVEKYRRAKEYCALPFEVKVQQRGKRVVPITGESIEASFTRSLPGGPSKQAYLRCAPSTRVSIPANSLDGVFTDPPYFANVQYAELMDFCYVWIRQALRTSVPEFAPETTRAADELTGNTTVGRDLQHFAHGLSEVFTRFAAGLKADAPFVFTYHHNDIEAYGPLVLALLDASLFCTAVLPAPAEMEASLHINNTASSIVDSVFVCRQRPKSLSPLPSTEEFERQLLADCGHLAAGGVRVSLGDVRCLIAGHIARLCVHQLGPSWDTSVRIQSRMESVREALHGLAAHFEAARLAQRAISTGAEEDVYQPRLFDTEIPSATAL